MIVIAAGGTGGHLYPAIALAQEFKKLKPELNVILTGSKTPIDKEIYLSSGLPFIILPFSRPMKSIVGIFKSIWMIGHSTLSALRLFKKEDIKVAVVCGGFACVPIAIAARLKGIPLVLLEQNAIPGRTNRFLASKAHTIFIEFEESKQYFLNNKNVIRAGNPIRENLLNITNDLSHNTIVFMGGSQGASKINEMASNVIPTLAHEIKDLKIIHLTGKNDFDRMKNIYSDFPNVEVFEFLHDMQALYSKASLIIGRSGATSIAELSCIGIPSIFIPYPHAKDDHQKANALGLVNSGAGIMIEEKDLNTDILLKTIRDLWVTKDKLTKIREALMYWSTPKAGETIANEIYKIIS